MCVSHPLLRRAAGNGRIFTEVKEDMLEITNRCLGEIMTAVYIFLVLPLCFSVDAATPTTEDPAYRRALNNGAKCRDVIRVVDQDGVPVAGVILWGSLQTGLGQDDFTPIDAVTDVNGEAVVEGICTERLSLYIIKEGYYNTGYELSYPDTAASPKVVDGKWQPYGGVRTILLKKIKNPVPMVHSKPCRSSCPSLGAWYGYDLERRQWVKPAGEGVHADILVRVVEDAKNVTTDFRVVMEVSFTNNPFAGAYMLKTDAYSEMKSVYEADTNANYQSVLRFVHEKHPRESNAPYRRALGCEVTDTRLSSDSYLVFRTRTKVDSEGKLVSAHYGKIYGRWLFFRCFKSGGVYFNVCENDTNLEDLEGAKYSQLRYRQISEAREKKK